MDAKSFLESKGIKLENCTLIAYVENAMRQPDLINLMEEYADIKIRKHRAFMEQLDKQLNK